LLTSTVSTPPTLSRRQQSCDTTGLAECLSPGQSIPVSSATVPKAFTGGTFSSAQPFRPALLKKGRSLATKDFYSDLSLARFAPLGVPPGWPRVCCGEERGLNGSHLLKCPKLPSNLDAQRSSLISQCTLSSPRPSRVCCKSITACEAELVSDVEGQDVKFSVRARSSLQSLRGSHEYR